jgi:hypothetical protein
MINSTYWTDVDEVAVFEELCGSHGGMAGTQSHRFIVYPAGFEPPAQEIVGAENVHRQFVHWLAQLGHDAYADLPDVPHRLVVPSDDDALVSSSPTPADLTQPLTGART